MTMQSVGVSLLHGASTYVSTFVTGNGLDGIKFVEATTSINNTAGDFTSHFTTTMEIYTNSTANPGPYTIKAVGTTAITVYESVTHTTNSTAFVIYGREMVKVAGVKDFNFLTGAAPVIDITSLDSTAKEKMMSLRDEGQLTFSLVYDLTQSASWQGQNMLDTDLKERRKVRWQLLMTDNTGSEKPTKFHFPGYVLSAPISGGVDQAVTRNVTIEIASAVDMTTRT